MKFKLLAIISLAMLSGPAAAVQIQSTTGVLLSFRQCVEGVTACDSISEMKLSSFGGLPGDSEAQASQEDPAYGTANGNSKLTDSNGNAQMSASISSLSGARNGSTVFILQRYTNTSEQDQKLTLGATLTYDQTVPAGNAAFTDVSAGQSVANAELGIFTLNVDAIEAGTTAEDNNYIFQSEPPPGVKHESLGENSASGSHNETGQGSKTFAVTALIPAGESVWLIGVLQALGVNGAVVNANLETKTTIE